ncbi:MAG: acyl-CoA dehydrogenase family protein [Promethearchaeota archaeon]
MDFETIPGLADFTKQFDDFFREEMKKAPPRWESATDGMTNTPEGLAFARNMSRELGKRGWLAMGWPEKYGGSKKSVFEQFAFSNSMTYWKAPGVNPFGLLILAPILLAIGTEEQKERFLPPIARGEIWWAQLWSEPDAGSDLAAVQTFAERDGDYYIINGHKTWTSYAHHCEWAHALVRTSRELKRSRGLTFLMLDMKSPGITMHLRPEMYSHGKVEAHFNDVFLDDVKVPVANRIGEENDGWRVVRYAGIFHRGEVARLGVLKRELSELINFCKEMKWQGEPLAKNPLVRQRLAQIAVAIEAGLAIGKHSLWGQHKLVLGEPVDAVENNVRSSSLKYGTNELYQHLIYTGCQIMGLYSQLKSESKWAPLYGRYEHEYQVCLGHNQGGGSTEIQKNIIAWEGLGLPRT